MKKILGLDLGTNSIGWALIENDFDKKEGKILGLGSRIIPMDAAIMGEFDKGNSVSQTATRTDYRGTRRLRERNLLRRERLHRVLNIFGFLPEHYANQIDFEKRLGQFLNETEPKIAWNKVWNKQKNKNDFEFIFQNSFNEMVEDFKSNGQDIKIPYDWTIYYLRKKALSRKIEKEELAWLLLNFNQKRGYYQLRGEEEEENQNKLVEFHSLKIIDVKADVAYKMMLSNGMEYRYETNNNLFEWKDTERKFVVTTYLNFDETPKKEIDGTNKRSIYMLKENETAAIKKKKDVSVEICDLKIVDVQEDTEKKKDDVWYSLILENGWIYRRSSKTSLFDWKNKVRDFIVTTDLNDDKTVKTDKEGTEKRSFRAPSEDDWTLLKKKTENDLDKYIEKYEEKNKIKGTVGAYIYETLLQNPTQKIRGKLVRTIERKFYKDELKAIVKKQIELQPELFTEDLYNDCIRELYRNNEAHQTILSKRNSFEHLFVDDIIFYQRPLRSQKSSIGNCTLEFRKYKDKDGKEIKEYLKGIPKSNPLYQEFRIWQWLYNLKIYSREDDKDVTADFLKSTDDYTNLFDFLMNRKEIDNKALITYFLNLQGIKGKNADKELKKYRWNYVFDNSKDKEEDKSKKYPCNKTRAQFVSRLAKVENLPLDFLTPEIEQKLWHIIYSVTDKNEYEKALKTFAVKHNLHEVSFVDNFKKLLFEEKDYGSFSEKAIKKLLPLMRLGKYWKWENITFETQGRIEKIITGEYDETIKERVREKAIKLSSENDFQGLQLWLAQYIVYGRHSETENADQWKMSYDIQDYLDEFKQHSLRNPIVEQIITETLRVVKDIWEQYASENNVECIEIYDEKKKKNVKSYGKFFDEIHIELGREMKNTADDRAKITNQVSDNENTNLRIKAMLMEFAEDGYFNNENNENTVRPYSQNQQDILKIYEEDVLRRYSEQELKNEKTGLIEKDDKGKEKEITYYDISKKSQPTKTQIQKYKLWLEQKYCSPYTGKMISLSRLFTPDYEIEHIIPQSRYFDDSLSNKVICEAAVNKLKDRNLGLEFIKKHTGEKVECGMGVVIEIFTEESYKSFVQEHYKNNNAKQKKLLLEEIPDKMIERQLNDTRYISKFVSALLSNIVREEKDDDGVNSKNLISGNGKITTTLKQSWGLNNVWNELILPRFERMNELKGTDTFTSKNTEGHIIPTIPLEFSKGFQKKRIDHRHHAMDALTIACMTREHVQYLNNENAKSQKFHLQKGLAKTLRKYETIEKTIQKKDETGIWRIKKDETGKQITKQIEVPKEYFMPWNNFVEQAKSELEKIIVSFKQNLRVINKVKFAGLTYKESKEKSNNRNWGIRKPLHEETFSGIVQLPWVKVGKGEFTTATRKALDKSFNEDKIEKITDTGIQKILKNYLQSKKNNSELAFSPDGIEELNKNISQYNDGKFHQPILKVRVYEKGKGRFVLGNLGNKKSKYVQGAPNLFFAIYEYEEFDKKENKNVIKRSYETIPLNIVIERLKQGLNVVPETNEEGHKLCLECPFLSPNDLVYVPMEDEKENIRAIDWENLSKEQLQRLFVVNDFSGTCYFTPNRLAKNIVPKEVDLNFDTKKNKLSGSYDTKTASFEGKQIKDVCIKLNIDRLGNIKPAL
ncbi:MAG: type II CRISPR RNA-guided endonuclease Cas9 [Bacteroidetes bacterium]|nr:type II CRISPR RNA-guided endonuclease Cas9 [Bacteroidota bacterium]